MVITRRLRLTYSLNDDNTCPSVLQSELLLFEVVRNLHFVVLDALIGPAFDSFAFVEQGDHFRRLHIRYVILSSLVAEGDTEQILLKITR